MLIGCSTLPQTIQEFDERENIQTQSFCSAKNLTEAYELLKMEMTTCYERSIDSTIPVAGVLVPMFSGTKVEAEINTESASLTLPAYTNRGFIGYQQLVTVVHTETCNSLVTVYGVGAGWKRHAARVNGWLEGKEAVGCGMW